MEVGLFQIIFIIFNIIIFYTCHIKILVSSPYISCGISGSFGSSDVGGMYSSSYGGDYMSRGNDVCTYPAFNARYCYTWVCINCT